MENKENSSSVFNDIQLPHSKIRKICKLAAPTSNVSSEAIKILTIGAQEYLKILSKSAHKFTNQENRKTIQMKDITKCINHDWMFSILEDAIEDWPTTNVTKKTVQNNLTTIDNSAINDDLIEVNEELDTETDNLEETENILNNEDIDNDDNNDSVDEIENEKNDIFEDYLNSPEEIEQQELNEELNLIKKVKKNTPRVQDIEDF